VFSANRTSVDRAILLVVVCVAGLTLGAAGEATAQFIRLDTAQPLSVFKRPLLPICAHQRVAGSYIQVAGRGLRLPAVNAALRAAAISDERQDCRAFERRALPAHVFFTYQASLNRRFISASSVVISALIPVSAPPPAGNEGAYWYGVTVDVSNGRFVHISDLFKSVRPALNALALAARRELTAGNPCVRGSLAISPDYAYGFAPTVMNYQDFALLPTGIAIGFSNDQVTAPACGRVEVTVPYRVIRPFTGTLGIKLMRGARWPKTR